MILVTEAAKRGLCALWLEGLSDGRAGGEVLRLDKTGTTPNGSREPKLALYLGEPEEGDDATTTGDSAQRSGTGGALALSPRLERRPC